MSCLSVIVPCYNGEKFIGRCLESLVNQTLQDIEIIVINDGSTDNSQDIIDSYANKYHNIKAYKIPNSGIADARNFGVSKVETPYFGFLDCDDYTDVTMFEKMYNKEPIMADSVVNMLPKEDYSEKNYILQDDSFIGKLKRNRFIRNNKLVRKIYFKLRGL